jgi:sporulation protein YlmC with PRC-barrel domain
MVITLVSFDELSDKFVICSGGFDLGQINGVEIDTGTWQVTHLRVKLSKSASEDLGFKKIIGSSTVCMPVSLISSIGDNVLLNKTLDELARHPEIRKCKKR